MVYTALREREAEELAKVDPFEVSKEADEAMGEAAIPSNGTKTTSPFITETLTCLPTNKNGVLDSEFWRYYQTPWNPIFFNFSDPFNDLVTIIWGPRGGGKTITGVSLSIIDGQMKGIPCISNVPFAWIAKGNSGKLYKVESIPFDQDLFAHGDQFLKYKRLLVDEGNYLADRMRSTSNKNLAMTDILQQARKFRMCVIFATINWMWLDSRITGSLLDLMIECNDLYYKGFGRKNHIQKGNLLSWDITDQSGKISGSQFKYLGHRPFNARYMWGTYNTENFVNPLEARKKLMAEQKMITDEFGQQVSMDAWFSRLKDNTTKLAKARPDWESEELWDALGISDRGLKVKAGQYMKGVLGVEKQQLSSGGYTYDLAELVT
jgi:hypothetical protein